MSEPYEEANGASLAIKLPLGIEVQLSEDERRCFYSLSEEQRRPFLKQVGVLPSVSGTAATANKLARIGLNRRAAQGDRIDALQGLILEELGKHLGATEAEVLKALEKRKGQGVIESITDSIIEWTDKDGSAQETPISALKYRILRARKKLQVR